MTHFGILCPAGDAPQLELLQKASLTITYAGMNTTLESLSNGVPMVAIPVANDQPGVAARTAWTGVGEVVPLKQLSVLKVQDAIRKVLTEESYKTRAIALQQAIQRSGEAEQPTLLNRLYQLKNCPHSKIAVLP